MKILKYLFGITLVLVLLFFGRGLLTPSVGYESEVVVNKSAKETWAVMNDATLLPKWIKGFIRSELVSGTPNTVGAVSHNYVDEDGQEMMMTETITAIELHKQLAMKFSMDVMSMDYKLSFKEADGKTTITSNTKTFGNGLFYKSLFSFMGGSMKTQEDENLGNLKKLVDGNTKNYFPEVVVQPSAGVME